MDYLTYLANTIKFIEITNANITTINMDAIHQPNIQMLNSIFTLLSSTFRTDFMILSLFQKRLLTIYPLSRKRLNRHEIIPP